MITNDIFVPEYILLWAPVFFIGGLVMRFAYGSLIDALIPWKDVEPEPDFKKGWIADERRQIETRRGEERRAAARAAYLRGDTSAIAMIGRRRSDYEELGLPFPGDLQKASQHA